MSTKKFGYKSYKGFHGLDGRGLSLRSRGIFVHFANNIQNYEYENY